MRFDRDATTVVDYRQTAIVVDPDLNQPAVASQGLIHTVVDQFVDEMMQSTTASVANVHAGPLANVRRITEDLEILLRIVRPFRGLAVPFTANRCCALEVLGRTAHRLLFHVVSSYGRMNDQR